MTNLMFKFEILKFLIFESKKWSRYPVFDHYIVAVILILGHFFRQ